MRSRILSIAVLVIVAFGHAASAESPPPFPDFSAKRIKAPPEGQPPKIDVQITRQDTVVSVPAETSTDQGTPAAIGNYAWFWDSVSPDIQDKGPGRLEPALLTLLQPPEGILVKQPRLDDLMRIASTHSAEILGATVGTNVSPALVLAMIAVESGGQVDVTSHAGAQGLMQLMPVTAKRFGVEDPFDSRQNISGGVAFVNLLMESFDDDPILVLAGYNAGENAVRKAQGVPKFAETRDYVPKVLSAYAVARNLCRTPPELLSDGCVFVLN
ncbi:transglycosylase SLT domain-containing protein [uncultured Shimia sp.]|uniref:transglycosylase SLT domain-containing protein n=1 Tax=uncultured Shimia sp. TaxID=573152 RepID=UPI0026289BCD|nr:transglycosylase SLT domain-containing protein [uncultured Shimia sp.]